MMKSLFNLGVYVFTSKKEADAIYTRLLPALRYIIQIRGRNSLEAQGLLEILEKLPAMGAQRSNFKRSYIDKPDGWKKLPDDPNALPYGFWH